MPNNAGVNKVFLIGQVVSNPRWHLINKMRVLCFLLATTEYIKKFGVNVPHIETHHIKASEKSIGNTDNLEKNSVISVQGRVQTTNWLTKTTSKDTRQKLLHRVSSRWKSIRL